MFANIMEYLADFLLFFFETATIVIAILIITAGVIAMSTKGKLKTNGKLVITELNDNYHAMKETLQKQLLSKKALKITQKQDKKKKKKTQEEEKKCLFVIRFNGDIRASQVASLREEITALLTIATPKDEVLLCLESPGGMVHGYGLAASQLKRIRDKGINLTIAIDKVAASGGYLMACIANKIIAAPFAIIGSVGVIAQLPNFNRFLKKHDIDFELLTAGEYKRTLTLFGENTDKGRQKFQEELEETHQLFKSHITANRPSVDVNKIGNGEHWYGTKAQELGLIDEINTSDDYLLKAHEDTQILQLEYAMKRSLGKKFTQSVQHLADKLYLRGRE